MDTTEAAWLAGIIDGEGTIQVSEYAPRCRQGGKSSTFEVIMSVVNTDKRITDRCFELCGGCTFGPVGRGKPGQWKPAYRWAIKRKRASAIAREILPFLVAKKTQAEILIHLDGLIKPGSLPGNCGVVKMPIEKIEQRRSLRLAMQALNHRGGTPIPQDRADALASVLLQLNNGASS